MGSTERPDQVSEWVLCAAIHVNDGFQYQGQPDNILKGYVLPGYRHSNCFSLLRHLDELRGGSFIGEVHQGFLTSKNRFVDRRIAFNIARKAEQLKNEKGPECLTSEDLY